MVAALRGSFVYYTEIAPVAARLVAVWWSCGNLTLEKKGG